MIFNSCGRIASAMRTPPDPGYLEGLGLSRPTTKTSQDREAQPNPFATLQLSTRTTSLLRPFIPLSHLISHTPLSIPIIKRIPLLYPPLHPLPPLPSPPSASRPPPADV